MDISTARDYLGRISTCYDAALKANQVLTLPQLCSEALIPALGDETRLLAADSLLGRLHRFFATTGEQRRASARLQACVGKAFVLLSREKDPLLGQLADSLKASLLQHYMHHPDWATRQTCAQPEFTQALRDLRLNREKISPEENPLRGMEVRFAALSTEEAQQLLKGEKLSPKAQRWHAQYLTCYLQSQQHDDRTERQRALMLGKAWLSEFESRLFPATPLLPKEKERRLQQQTTRLQKRVLSSSRFVLPMRIDGGRHAWRELFERIRRLPPELQARLPAQVKPFLSGEQPLNPETMVEDAVHQAVTALRQAIQEGQANGKLPHANADLLEFLELLERHGRAIPVGAQRFLDGLPDSVRLSVEKLWRLCLGPQEEWIKLAAKLVRASSHLTPLPSFLFTGLDTVLNVGRIAAKVGALAERIEQLCQALGPFQAYHHADSPDSPQWQALEKRLVCALTTKAGPRAELVSDRLDEMTAGLSSYVAPEFFDLAGLPGLVEGGELYLEFMQQEDKAFELRVYAPSNHARWHEAGWPLRITDIPPERITPQLCRRLLELAAGERLGTTQGVSAAAFYEGVLPVLGGKRQHDSGVSIPALQADDHVGMELAYQLRDPTRFHEEILRMRMSALLDATAGHLLDGKLEQLQIEELHKLQLMLRPLERELHKLDSAALERLAPLKKQIEALSRQLDTVVIQEKRDLAETLLKDLPIDPESLEQVRDVLSWFVGGRYDAAFEALEEVIGTPGSPFQVKGWWERVAEEFSWSVLLMLAASILSFAYSSRGTLAKFVLGLGCYRSGKVFLPDEAYMWCLRVESALQRELARYSLLFLWYLLSYSEKGKRIAASLNSYASAADHVTSLLSQKQTIDLKLDAKAIELRPDEAVPLELRDGAVRLSDFKALIATSKKELLSWEDRKETQLLGSWPSIRTFDEKLPVIRDDLESLQVMAKQFRAIQSSEYRELAKLIRLMDLLEQLPLPREIDGDLWQMENSETARAALQELVRMSCLLHNLYALACATQPNCIDPEQLGGVIKDRYLLCQYAQSAIAWQLARQDEQADLQAYQVQPQELRLLYWSRLWGARKLYWPCNGHNPEFHRRLHILCNYFQLDLSEPPTAESLRRASRDKLFSYLHIGGFPEEKPPSLTLTSHYVEARYIAKLMARPDVQERIQSIPGLRLLPADKQYLCLLWEEPLNFRTKDPIVPRAYSLVRLQIALTGADTWSTGVGPEGVNPDFKQLSPSLYSEQEEKEWSSQALGTLTYVLQRSEHSEQERLRWTERRAQVIENSSRDISWTARPDQRERSSRQSRDHDSPSFSNKPLDLAHPRVCEQLMLRLAKLSPAERFLFLVLTAQELKITSELAAGFERPDQIGLALSLARLSCLLYHTKRQLAADPAFDDHYCKAMKRYGAFLAVVTSCRSWPEVHELAEPPSEFDAEAQNQLPACLLILHKKISTGDLGKFGRAWLEKILYFGGPLQISKTEQSADTIDWLSAALRSIAESIGLIRPYNVTRPIYPSEHSQLRWLSLPNAVREELDAPGVEQALEAMRKRDIALIRIKASSATRYASSPLHTSHIETQGLLADLGRTVYGLASGLLFFLASSQTERPTELRFGLQPIYRAYFDKDHHDLKINDRIVYPLSEGYRFLEVGQAELAAGKPDKAQQLFQDNFSGLSEREFRNIYAERSEVLTEALAYLDRHGRNAPISLLMRAVTDPVRLEQQFRAQPQFAVAMGEMLARLWKEKRTLWSSSKSNWKDPLMLIQACVLARAACRSAAPQVLAKLPDPAAYWLQLDRSVSARSVQHCSAFLAVRCLLLEEQESLKLADIGDLLTFRLLLGTYINASSSLETLAYAITIEESLLGRHRWTIFKALNNHGLKIVSQTIRYLGLPLAKSDKIFCSSAWAYRVGVYEISYFTGRLSNEDSFDLGSAMQIREEQLQLQALIEALVPHKAGCPLRYQHKFNGTSWRSQDGELKAHASRPSHEKAIEWKILVKHEDRWWRLLPSGQWLEEGVTGGRELREQLHDVRCKKVYQRCAGHYAEVRPVEARRAADGGTAAEHPGLRLLSRIAKPESLQLEADAEGNLTRVIGKHLDLEVRRSKGKERLFVGELAPGYMVSEDQMHKDLRGIPSYLLLNDSGGKHKVLLSRGQALSASSWRLGKNLGRFAPLLAESLKSYARNCSDPYCLFSIDSDGQLSSRDPADLTDLMYLYLARGEEERAERVAYKLLEVLRTEQLSHEQLDAVDRNLLVLASIPLPHLPLTRIRLKLRVSLERARGLLDPKDDENQAADPKAMLLIGPCSSMIADLVMLSESRQLDQLFDSEMDEWLAYSILSREMRQLLGTQIQSDPSVKGILEALIGQIGWNRLLATLLKEPLKTRYIELQRKYGAREGGWLMMAYDLSQVIFGKRSLPGSGALGGVLNFVRDPVSALWGKLFTEDDFSQITKQGSLRFASSVAPCLGLKQDTLELRALVDSIWIEDDQYRRASDLPLKHPLSSVQLRKAFYTCYRIAYGEHTNDELVGKLRDLLALNHGGWDAQSRYLILVLRTVLEASHKAYYPHPERLFEKARLVKLEEKLSQNDKTTPTQGPDELKAWSLPQRLSSQDLCRLARDCDDKLANYKIKASTARELRRRIWLCIQSLAKLPRVTELSSKELDELSLAARLAYPSAKRQLGRERPQKEAEELLLSITRDIVSSGSSEYSVAEHEKFLARLSRTESNLMAIRTDDLQQEPEPAEGDGKESPQEAWSAICTELHRVIFLGLLQKEARSGAASLTIPLLKSTARNVLSGIVQNQMLGVAGTVAGKLLEETTHLAAYVNPTTIKGALFVAQNGCVQDNVAQGVSQVAKQLFGQSEQAPGFRAPQRWRAKADQLNVDIDAIYEALTSMLFTPHSQREAPPPFKAFEVPGNGRDPLIAERQSRVNQSGREHAQEEARRARQIFSFNGRGALIDFALVVRQRHAQACREVEEAKSALLEALNADRQPYLGVIELKRRFTEADLDCYFMTGSIPGAGGDLQLPLEHLQQLEISWSELCIKQTRLQDQLGRVLEITERALEKYQRARLLDADTVLEDLLEELQARRTWKACALDAALARRYLVFEKRWGFLLWSKQSTRFHEWLRDMEKSVLCELIMGLGKSDAGIPIGQAHAADGEHIVAVCWPTEMAATNIEKTAGNAWSVFRQEVHRLVFNRQKKIDAATYRALHQLHQHILIGRGALHATRWDFSSLELMFIQMLYEGAEGKLGDRELEASFKELQSILKLYRTRGVLFVDEIHEVDLYKRQQCWPLGDADCLPKDYYRPLAYMLSLLLSQKNFAHYLSLNKMKALPQKIFESERTNVLAALCKGFLIAPKDHEDFCAYATGKLDGKPEAFVGHQNEAAIDIARGVFATLLPQCMEKAVNVHFGWSDKVEDGEEFAKPYMGNETPRPSSVTKDPYRCLVESFLMMGWSGVQSFQYDRICSRLLKSVEREASAQRRSPEDTYSASLYTEVTGLPVTDKDYTATYRERKRCSASVHQTGGSMYHQVKFWRDSLRSNAQNFHSMFAITKSCTGTPYNDESCADAEIQLDPGTLGKAIATIDAHCPDEKVAVLEAERAEEVLEEVLSCYFNGEFRVRMLVDGGALLRGVANQRVAARLWEFAQTHRPEIKAITFFDKAGRMMSYEGPGNILQRSQSSVSKEFRLSYLDQNHGFGANEPMPRAAKVVVLVSPSDPTHRKVQEGFRARSIKKIAQLVGSDGASQQLYFATTRMGHRMITGIDTPSGLKPKTLPLRMMWTHTIKEEAKLVEPANVQSYQDKLHNVSRRVLLDRLLDDGSFGDAVSRFKKGRSLLVAHQTVNPTELFGARRIIASKKEFVEAKQRSTRSHAAKLSCFSYADQKKITTGLKSVKVPTLPHELPLWVDAKGEAVDGAFDVGGELTVEASSLQTNQQQEMQQEHEAAQTLENDQELKREQQPFKEWYWNPKSDYCAPSWMSDRFGTPRSGDPCPLISLRDLAKESLPEVARIASYLDQRLWFSNNFLPTYLRFAGEIKRRLGSKQQRPLECVLVYASVDSRGKLTIDSMGALSARDIGFLREKIASGAKSSSKQVFLYHIACSSVVAGDKVSNAKLQQHADFQGLIAQLKLLDGQHNFGNSLDSLFRWMRPTLDDPQRHEQIASALAKIAALREREHGPDSDFETALRRCQGAI